MIPRLAWRGELQRPRPARILLPRPECTAGPFGVLHLAQLPVRSRSKDRSQLWLRENLLFEPLDALLGKVTTGVDFLRLEIPGEA